MAFTTPVTCRSWFVALRAFRSTTDIQPRAQRQSMTAERAAQHAFVVLQSPPSLSSVAFEAVQAILGLLIVVTGKVFIASQYSRFLPSFSSTRTLPYHLNPNLYPKRPIPFSNSSTSHANLITCSRELLCIGFGPTNWTRAMLATCRDAPYLTFHTSSTIVLENKQRVM